MKYKLSAEKTFSSAHALRGYKGKCEHIHGHNWKVEACITGKTINDAGVVIDFGMIKKHVSEIMAALDHKFLNELDWFKEINPSSEVIAKRIAQELQARIEDPSIRVSSVTAWESDDACAKYICS